MISLYPINGLGLRRITSKSSLSSTRVLESPPRRHHTPFTSGSEKARIISSARSLSLIHIWLAELGDTETGRNEIAEADKAYREAIGGTDWMG